MTGLKKLYLWWRWLKIKRVKVRRYVLLELPSFSRVNERAAGDNYPVLARISVRVE